MRQITGITADASGKFNYYCRQCGQIHYQKSFPICCKRCGNTEVSEGFGVSGDKSVDNTTETVTWNASTWYKVTTIDKERR